MRMSATANHGAGLPDQMVPSVGVAGFGAERDSALTVL